MSDGIVDNNSQVSNKWKLTEADLAGV
jgi:hypothetical protein